MTFCGFQCLPICRLNLYFSNTADGRMAWYHFFQASIASNRCCSVKSSGGPRPSKLRLMNRSSLRASSDDAPVGVGERVEQRGHVIQVAGAAECPHGQQAHFGFAAAHELLQPACAFFIDLVDDQLARIAGQVVQQGVVTVVDHREQLIDLRMDLLDDQLAVAHLRAGQIGGQAAAGEQHAFAELGIDALLRGAQQKQDRERRVAFRSAIARPTAVCRLLGGRNS